MNKEKINEAGKLQNNADILSKYDPAKTTSSCADDQWNLMYQLRESRLELTMQSRKLNLALSGEADAVRVFNSTPVGIFTISGKGEIINLNICGSQMLNKKRENLIKSRLGFFVADDCKRTFNLFIEHVLNNKIKETCELTLLIDDNIIKFVQLTGIASDINEQCLVAMFDITRLKQAEHKLALQIEEKEKLAEKLAKANKEKEKQLAALVIANREKARRVAKLARANKEKTKRIAALVKANNEKASLTAELILANKEKSVQIAELIKANDEKAALAKEIWIANKEKIKRVAEYIIENKEKAARAAELFIAKQELSQNINN